MALVYQVLPVNSDFQAKKLGAIPSAIKPYKFSSTPRDDGMTVPDLGSFIIPNSNLQRSRINFLVDMEKQREDREKIQRSRARLDILQGLYDERTRALRQGDFADIDRLNRQNAAAERAREDAAQNVIAQQQGPPPVQQAANRRNMLAQIQGGARLAPAGSLPAGPLAQPAAPASPQLQMTRAVDVSAMQELPMASTPPIAEDVIPAGSKANDARAWRRQRYAMSEQQQITMNAEIQRRYNEALEAKTGKRISVNAPVVIGNNNELYTRIVDEIAHEMGLTRRRGMSYDFGDASTSGSSSSSP